MDTLSTPQIVTNSGALVGAMADDRVRVFKGVPYATPPVGSLRWRPPQPVRPWEGVRSALEFGPDCPQVTDLARRADRESEDCLYLNVWAPADAEPGSLPVMVWVHGGSYSMGSGSEPLFDGVKLAREGVVVVTLNYRLGIFGFLAHPGLTKESPNNSSSNYGLLDQIQAFEWIRDNIAAFGGDPQNVTAFGVSAGSASLSLLLTSPLANQLFQRAILHSPGAARRLATLQQAEENGLILGDDIEALRRMSPEELLARMPDLGPKVRGLTTPRMLRPICDGWVIPENERAVFVSGRLPAVPIIVGTNTDEGSDLTKGWPVRALAQYEDLVQQNFGEFADEARQLYPASDDEHVRGRVAELFADTQFNYGARLLGQAMASKAPTWRYVFTRRYPGRTEGPMHGQETAYVFGNLSAPQPNDPVYDDIDDQLSNAMFKTWLAFAKTGDPNNEVIPQWERFNPARDNFLEFGDRIVPGTDWRRPQLDFMERFFGAVDRPEEGK